jgi:hypothetical protein
LAIQSYVPPYHVPLAYIQDVLFGQTAHGLVQGMLTTFPVLHPQQVQVVAIFGTSQPVLLLVIMGISLACALSATLASMFPKTARESVELDVPRLLVISRNPQFDDVFAPCSDRTDEMDEKVLSARIRYEWVEGLKRRALVT